MTAHTPGPAQRDNVAPIQVTGSVTFLIRGGTREREIAGRHPWSELDQHLDLPRLEGYSWRIHGFKVLEGAGFDRTNAPVELYATAVPDQARAALAKARGEVGGNRLIANPYPELADEGCP